jgi:hypothetical protein
MKSYAYPSLIFKKNWYWFTNPTGKEQGDVVNIFSYDKTETPGYKRKIGQTSVISLDLSLDLIWEKMRKRFVREQIAKGERNGVKIVVDDAWSKLVPVYKDFRKGKNLANDDPRVFRECLVVNAYLDERVIAGGAFIADGTSMRAYVLASGRFSGDGREREIIGQANRMVIWEAMKYAKQQGYKLFDLGGINPESTVQWERTLAEFKESFGGERKACYYYSKVNSPVLRLLLKLRRYLK